jgi:erythromycin esterase
MIKTYLTLLIIALPILSTAQDNRIEAATVQIHVDKDGRFSNLSMLNSNFEGVRVVTLGEQTHYDGATFDAKIQLVKYLHEELGFNILAFESGYFDCSKAAELLANEGSPGILKDAVFGVWDNKSLAELEAYILHPQTTASPLVVTGFDLQFSGRLAKQYLLEDLTAFLKKINGSELISDPNWSAFGLAVQRQIKYSNFYKKPSASDTSLIGMFCRRMEHFIAEADDATDEAGSKFWLRVLENLRKDSKRRFANENYRDSIMAENLLGLVAQEFKNDKVICWGATSHFMFNPKSIQSKEYKTFIPMGEYLHKDLNEELFTVAFTSLKGRAGSLITHQLKDPPKASYEEQVARKGYPYAFTSLRKMSQDEQAGKIVEARILGNKFKHMHLNRVVDGIFYIETAYPPRVK